MPHASEQVIRDPIGEFPPATVACFDPTMGDLPRRQIDEPRTIQFLERLGSLQVPAVLIAASTGHGHLRTPHEIGQWMRIAARASLPNTVKQVLLRPEDGLQSNRELVRDAAKLGYPIIFIRPGRNLLTSASDNEVAENIRPTLVEAAQLGLAVGVYSIPDVSGLPLRPEAVVKLLEGPGGDHLVAVKVTESDYAASTLRFLEHPKLKRLKIVQGWDPHLAQALKDGPKHDRDGRQRCGVTSGPMSFAVHQYLHILDAADRQQWDEVMAAQAAVTSLFQAMQDDPRKFADLQRAKYIMGLGHPLTAAVTTSQTDRVFQALESLPRKEDRTRLARSLDLLDDGPFHGRLQELMG